MRVFSFFPFTERLRISLFSSLLVSMKTVISCLSFARSSCFIRQIMNSSANWDKDISWLFSSSAKTTLMTESILSARSRSRCDVLTSSCLSLWFWFFFSAMLLPSISNSVLSTASFFDCMLSRLARLFPHFNHQFLNAASLSWLILTLFSKFTMENKLNIMRFEKRFAFSEGQHIYFSFSKPLSTSRRRISWHVRTKRNTNSSSFTDSPTLHKKFLNTYNISSVCSMSKKPSMSSISRGQIALTSSLPELICWIKKCCKVFGHQSAP